MGDKNRLPDVFSVEQLQKLFDAIDRPKVAIAAALALFCGLRISEVCGLRVDDIDLQNKRLKVEDSKNPMRAKTGYGKDRYVPIPDGMLSPLTKWFDIIGGGKWLLPSHKSLEQHIRKKSLNEQFRQALERAGLLIPDYEIEYRMRIKRKWTPRKVTRHKYHFHTLRHAYATYLLSKGVDLYTISTLLGHNQITTTQIYARVTDTKRRAAIDEAFNASLRSRPLVMEGSTVQEKMIEMKRLELEVRKMELEGGRHLTEGVSKISGRVGGR